MHKKRKTSEVHPSSCKSTKKVCNENERNKQEKKRHAHKNVIDAFIGYVWERSVNNIPDEIENVMHTFPLVTGHMYTKIVI